MQLVVDLSEQYKFYMSSAPAILNNYISFKDFISLLTNTSSTPGYDEEVIEGIISLLSSKSGNMLENVDNSTLELIELYAMSYVTLLDTVLEDILGKYKLKTEDTFPSYIIQHWLDNKTAIVSLNYAPVYQSNQWPGYFGS